MKIQNQNLYSRASLNIPSNSSVVSVSEIQKGKITKDDDIIKHENYDKYHIPSREKYFILQIS